MSTEYYNEEINYEMIYKPNDNPEIIPYEKYEENIIFEMMYKPNENNSEKLEKMNQFKDRHFYLDDKKEYDEDVILRLFGNNFVNKNKNKCKIIYKNKKYKLKDYFEEIEAEYIINPDIFNLVKLRIIFMNNCIDLSNMFYGCYHLISFLESPKKQLTQDIACCNDIIDGYDSNKFLCKEIKLNNYSGNIDNNNLFYYKYFNQLALSSKKIIKTFNMRYMFAGCISLISLPNILNLDTSHVSDMLALFFGCNSLKSIPDISNWDISSTTDIGAMFLECNSLKSLPDISK